MGFGAGAQQSWQSQSLELLLALAGLSQCCREDQGPLLTFTALHVGRKEMRPWEPTGCLGLPSLCYSLS